MATTVYFNEDVTDIGNDKGHSFSLEIGETTFLGSSPSHMYIAINENEYIIEPETSQKIFEAIDLISLRLKHSK